MSTPHFLQGVFPFAGTGLATPAPLHPSLRYVVPSGLTAQPLYFRGGNSSDELVHVALTCDGRTMRLFPMGARGAVNIPLHELLTRLDEVPAGRLWIHCGSGYRSGVAASLLERAGKDPVHNFMSYGDDKCLDRFTKGQVARMSAAWQLFRAPGAGASIAPGRHPREPGWPSRCWCACPICRCRRADGSR